MTSADTEFAVFTDEGPWVLDPGDLAWKAGLSRVRDELHASLPGLIRARKSGPTEAPIYEVFETWKR